MAFSIQQIYRNHIVLLCAILLPLFTLSLSYLSIRDHNRAVEHELHTQAAMLAMAFVTQNAASGAELSSQLRRVMVNPSVMLACVMTREGTARAQVQNDARISSDFSCNPSRLTQLADTYFVVHAPIVDANLPQSSSEVVLVGERASTAMAVMRAAFFSLLLCAVLALLNWFLGIRLQQILLTPIRQIATTAQRVSLYKDYSLRVVAGALALVPKEIEALTDSFNAMLHEIEDRDKRLTRKGEELEKSRHAAVAASQAKSQFLANVSHELRTPLNAIIGFSTMLEAEQFGPIGHEKYVEYARDIHDSGRHLLDVINDILDLTKAETGTLSVTFEQLNLAKIIEKALNIVAGHAHERRIDIYTDLPEKLPKLYADRVRLVQILLNLLSNAIKFSNEGGKVIIRARAEAGRNSIHYFTIEIEDQGIGMSDVDVIKAFQTFNQSDSGLNRKYDGAGLGLPLTKRLVELHHGKIKIDSALEKGTIVTVRLTSDPGLMD